MLVNVSLITQEDWVLCRVFNKRKPSGTEQSSGALNHNRDATLLSSLQRDITMAPGTHNNHSQESTAVSHCGSSGDPPVNLAMFHQDSFVDYCSPIVHDSVALGPHSTWCSGGGGAMTMALGGAVGFEDHNMGEIIEKEYDAHALLLDSCCDRDGIFI